MSQKLSKTSRIWKVLQIIIWFVVSFYLAQFLVVGIVKLGILLNAPIEINDTLANALLTACAYILAILLVIFVPRLFKKARTTLADLKLNGLPTWKDIFLAPAALFVYLIISAVLMLLAQQIIPGFDADQAQDVGFTNLHNSFEYILALITLVVITPIAEEVLFRGYLYSKIKKYLPIWLTIIIISVLFGALHGAWNLAIDTFALSVMACILRETTDNLWAPILLHATKNGIAFFILFISPLLTTLG